MTYLGGLDWHSIQCNEKNLYHNLVLLTALISKNILKRRQFKLWLFYNGEFEFTLFIKI